MARHGLILSQDGATSSRKVFRYLPGLRDTVKKSNIQKSEGVWVLPVGAFGCSWAPHGPPMGALAFSWVPLEHPVGAIGCAWAPRGPPLGALGLSWVPLSSPWALLGDNGRSGSSPGTLLGSLANPWDRFWTPRCPFRLLLGVFWGTTEPLWSTLGHIWAPS